MRTDVLLDRSDRKIIAVTTQDVGPILDRNAELRAQPQRGDFGRHVASIPNVILVRWLNEEYARGNTDLRMFTPAFNELVARKLRD
ncbi:MAG TPA: hypothetical protein VNC81_03950, partial [Xanthobacteraceae bacterium]|nr:hypothetical protein [Xanthobacteraceae bacterium]